MKKKALRKDFYMEIRKSLSRFLSIFFIVAIGVAFFSGIRSTEPDMRYSGDAYFDGQNLMDVKVVSTLGLTEDDVKAVGAVDGIQKVEAGYSVDALCNVNDSEKVVHITSILPSMNQLVVEKGRLPKKQNECVVDVDFIAGSDYKIGDTIRFTEGNDKNIKDTLKTDQYKIVGLVSSPCYISFYRGSSSIGTGTVGGFVAVPEKSFDSEVYTELYATVDGAKSLTAFTDGYNDRVEEVLDHVKEIKEERQTARYDEVVDEANEELDKAKKELSDAKSEADEKLADAKAKLDDGRQQLEDAKQKIADGKQTIAENTRQLYAKQAELDDSQAELSAKQEELYANQDELNGNQAELSAQQAELTAKQNELSAGQAELDEKSAGLQAGIEQLNQQADAVEQMKEQYAALEAGGATDPVTLQTMAILKAQIDAAEPQIQTTRTQLDEAGAQIQAAQAQIDAGQAQINDGQARIDDGQAQINAGQAQIDDGQAQINAGQAQIDDGQNQINDGWAKIETAKAELTSGETEIAENEKKLNDAQAEYDDAKAEADEKIADAEKKLADGEDEIEKIDHAKWYIYDRSTLTEYDGYGENADRMRAIGKVFPVLFFLVAALISLTTMTRMVEEQRTQIGTLKALGYGKGAIAFKYLGYAFIATMGGCITGVLIGEKIFPYIIIVAYGIMYQHMNIVLAPYNMYYAAMATAAAMGCTIVATTFACYKELRAQPAELMRPPAPKNGKRVFMERLPFIWKHLSFIWKATIRNLIRYKKRFFMTVFGIGGCMALLLVGFGLKDSIFDIALLQYNEIQVYDGMVIVKDEASDAERSKLHDVLSNNKDVKGAAQTLLTQVTVEHGSKEKEIYLNVPEKVDSFSDYVRFEDRITKEKYTLNDDGVIMTEKTAKQLDVKAGDTIIVQDDVKGELKVKVTTICENYIGHYIYMTPGLYENLYGKEPLYNADYFELKKFDKATLRKTGEAALDEDAALGVSYTSDVEEQLDDMLASLNIVLVVLIISAGMLAFVVLYNLNNINITERKRELATLKVLGFYDKEVSSYVYRENVVLTFVGAGFGALLGRVLHRFIIVTVEIDNCMFGRNIDFSSYIYSVLITVAFSLFVNWVMYYKLKKINMVESLKSVE